MVDISTEFAGLKLKNPVMTAAGPAARDGKTLLNATAGGVGGLVAKTVSIKPADVLTQVALDALILIDNGNLPAAKLVFLFDRGAK